MLVYFLFAVGFAALILGGEWLVRGAAGIARVMHIPPLIIGLTIVAFGTSAPELIVSLQAALDGAPGLAVGNVVGSNIANVLLVLGVAALFASIRCEENGMRSNVLILVALSVGFALVMADGQLSRVDGVALLAVLLFFLGYQFAQARQQASVQRALLDDIPDTNGRPLVLAGYTIAGLVLLPLAAHVTVGAAREIALRWGVPDDVIGLTIVAIGTSLPELATGISAARQKNTSVLVGSIVGSNLFNIAAIMGITAVVVPVPVSAHIMGFDNWIMLAATALLAFIAWSRVPVRFWMGAVMVLLYLAYLGLTVAL